MDDEEEEEDYSISADPLAIAMVKLFYYVIYCIIVYHYMTGDFHETDQRQGRQVRQADSSALAPNRTR